MLLTKHHLDLTGQTIGLLSVSEPVGCDAFGKMNWRCRCVCGNEVLRSVTQLRRPRQPSCGCVPTPLGRPRGSFSGPRNTKREKTIVTLRRQGQTLAQIGKRFQLSRERVRKIVLAYEQRLAQERQAETKRCIAPSAVDHLTSVPCRPVRPSQWPEEVANPLPPF